MEILDILFFFVFLSQKQQQQQLSTSEMADILLVPCDVPSLQELLNLIALSGEDRSVYFIVRDHSFLCYSKPNPPLIKFQLPTPLSRDDIFNLLSSEEKSRTHAFSNVTAQSKFTHASMIPHSGQRPDIQPLAQSVLKKVLGLGSSDFFVPCQSVLLVLHNLCSSQESESSTEFGNGCLVLDPMVVPCSLMGKTASDLELWIVSSQITLDSRHLQSLICRVRQFFASLMMHLAGLLFVHRRELPGDFCKPSFRPDLTERENCSSVFSLESEIPVVHVILNEDSQFRGNLDDSSIQQLFVDIFEEAFEDAKQQSFPDGPDCFFPLKEFLGYRLVLLNGLVHVDIVPCLIDVNWKTSVFSRPNDKNYPLVPSEFNFPSDYASYWKTFPKMRVMIKMLFLVSLQFAGSSSPPDFISIAKVVQQHIQNFSWDNDSFFELWSKLVNQIDGWDRHSLPQTESDLLTLFRSLIVSN